MVTHTPFTPFVIDFRQEVLVMERSAEIKELILRFYDAFSSGDTDGIARMTSQADGTLGIGTDPNEWWDGYSTLSRITQTQLQEMRSAGITLVAGDPQCFQEGSVAWTVDRPSIRLADGTETPTRLTTIFHKEGDEWKMVHFHTSIGVPNAEALGTDLTT
jgi:ketosteroid isomerase-like protein